ncbi:hypothetical protein MW290_25485 [Aquincola tertiaricarbonis]|uniref:DUF1983 domain-containing protein n=1 Tax=Aquincola tertiaricarbonis TaxID=391953 RepID=A0ABY4SCG8_AQUTE|nr:hypothetical protein [Aquincola tertiaricarbonis]URI08924.1 hypothetical protein MW290_25485 [Aquincola tertiaricarbonis]
MSTPTIPDLPDVDPKNPDSLRRFMGALKEIVQTREGRRGQKLDKAVTFRDLQDIGIVQQQPTTGGFVPGPATGGGGGTGGTGGSGSTDMTPPPAVDLAGMTVTAGFASIFIEWPAQTYTTGGGNAYTEVWAATYGGTGPLPTFANAKLVNLSEAPLFAYTVGLGVQVHVWLKNVSRAGVAQLVPTGGTNGKSATTGKIGSTDLAPLIIEAQHMKDQSVIQRVIAEKAINYQQLADGAVRVQHLLVAPTSLVVDPTFAQGTAGWSAIGSSGYFVARYHKSHPAVPSPTLLPTDYAAVFAGRDAQMLTRLKVEPGEQYKASVLVHKNNDVPSTGWVALFFDANGSYGAGHVAQTSSPAPWFRVEDSFTVPAGAVTMSVAPWNGQAHEGTIGSWFANLQVEKKNDATLIVDGSIWAQHLKAGAIAVGTAAIADGAIINAMIAEATIESAKIKSLSADKITAGRIAVGQYIASAGFNSGSAGWAIWGSGDAEFNNITIRNSTYTGIVYAGGGTIGGIRINAFQFNNDGYVPGTSGFALFSNGGAEFNQGATFRGELDVGGNSGQRVKITNAGVQVFNSGNVAVIELGIY